MASGLFESSKPLPGDWAVVTEAGSPVERMQSLIRGSTPRYRRYIHAFMLVDLNPVTIVEAMPGGMQRVPLHYADTTLYWSNGVFQPTDAERTLIVASANYYAARKVGYSFIDYSEVGLHSWGIPFPGLEEAIKDVGHMMCSYAVDRMCLEGGEHLFNDDRWPGFVAPMHLAERIAAP
jgi:hypothetical protein